MNWLFPENVRQVRRTIERQPPIAISGIFTLLVSVRSGFITGRHGTTTHRGKRFASGVFNAIVLAIRFHIQPRFLFPLLLFLTGFAEVRRMLPVGVVLDGRATTTSTRLLPPLRLVRFALGFRFGNTGRTEVGNFIPVHVVFDGIAAVSIKSFAGLFAPFGFRRFALALLLFATGGTQIRHFVPVGAVVNRVPTVGTLFTPPIGVLTTAVTNRTALFVTTPELVFSSEASFFEHFATTFTAIACTCHWKYSPYLNRINMQDVHEQAGFPAKAVAACPENPARGNYSKTIGFLQ